MERNTNGLAVAPAGFTSESWQAFARDGILVIDDALPSAAVEALRAAIDDQAKSHEGNIVAGDPRFAGLIDHPAHIGYMHDVYGDMLKLLRSEYFKRETGQVTRNDWHFDGPRMLPFQVFGDRVPLRVKIGYWLTPLPEAGMGNLVYIPGSHRRDHLPQYHTHNPHPEEKRLIVRPGAMTLMWGGLWHRVDVNSSTTTRQNLFLEYGPSWVTASDRVVSDPAWAEQLPRERRIIMRAYREQNQCVKPPERDVPLYLPRAGEPDAEAGLYADHVPLSLRKRSTWLEMQGLA
ncbi:phytanoyl-CoA dioxygenase family protein [Streptomyces sp. NPDC048258]|uniref:phytanoyl-CoA dioxygenase family protein n=1 Tax=Streptomyces sp. NPDC048258 TaxID=3365527 RepID=UPI00371B03D2